MDNHPQSYWNFGSTEQPFSWGSTSYLNTGEPLKADIMVWAEEISRVKELVDDEFFEMAKVLILRDFERRESN